MKHKTKILFTIGLGTALIGGFILPVDAYSPHITHAPLTGKSVDLYNQFYPTSGLSAQEKEWLMEGAAGEDNPFTRAMYHFYDPINNSGITGYESSKWWVHNGAAQSAIAWPPGTDGDYSWEEALAAYERGDKEKAYIALGHVIHLVQDASVPAHTRNDPHPGLHEKIHGGADPFEQDVKPFQAPGIAGLRPVIYRDLDTYFDNVALYSNTGFYSKNSVGFYEKPIPIRMDDKYVYGRDEVGEYKLFAFKKDGGQSNFSYVSKENLEFSLDNTEVLQDYWNRLAPTAVENGAGIINLFQESVKNIEVEEPQKLSFWDKTNNFINSFSKGADSVLGWLWKFNFLARSSNIQTEVKGNPVCEELKPYLMTSAGDCNEYNFLVSATTPEENQQAQQYFYSQLQDIAPTGVGSDLTPVAEEYEVDDTTDTTNTTDTTQNADKTETIDTTQNTASHFVTRVIDGDTIELQNGERVRYIGVNTPEEPDGCFAPEAAAYNTELVLNKTVTLEQGPTDKDNYGRLLRYVYAEGVFVNEILVETGHAYAFDYNDPHKFSEKFEDIEEQARADRRGLWGDECHPVGGEVKGDSTDSNPYQSPYGPTGPNGGQPVFRQQNIIPQAGPDHIIINEVQTADSEFVELYNPTDSPVDLTNYYFAYYSSTRQNWKDDSTDDIDPDGPVNSRSFSEAENTTIPAKGYYLIGFYNYPKTGGNPNTDWQPYDTRRLSGTKGTIAIFSENPKESESPEPIDAVAWGDDEDVTLKETQTTKAPDAGKSISRSAIHEDTDNNFADFTTQDPTPTNSAGNTLIIELWSRDIRYTGMRQMLVDNESNLYYSSGTYILKKFSPDGELLWENSKESRSHLFVALSPDYQYVYAVECERDDNNSNIVDCYFTAFSALDGTELVERVSVGRRGNNMQPVPDIAGDNVYIAGRQKIYALNIFTEDVLIWERFNYELGGGFTTQFGPPVAYGGKLYAVQRDGRSFGFSELAIIDKGTGEVSNYLRLDLYVATIQDTSNKPALVGDTIVIAYTGSGCGASRQTGYAVYNPGELDDMQDTAVPAQIFRTGCHGKLPNIQGLDGEAYTVPTDFARYPWRDLIRIYSGGEGLVEASYVFKLDSGSTPSGKIFISPDKNIYLFTREGMVYRLSKNFEDNPVSEYFLADYIYNLAAGTNTLYLLTQNHIKALSL